MQIIQSTNFQHISGPWPAPDAAKVLKIWGLAEHAPPVPAALAPVAAPPPGAKALSTAPQWFTRRAGETAIQAALRAATARAAGATYRAADVRQIRDAQGGAAAMDRGLRSARDALRNADAHAKSLAGRPEGDRLKADFLAARDAI